MQRGRIAALILIGTFAFAQTPSQTAAPTATIKQIMLDLIHPAANDILLFISRGTASDAKEWAVVRRGALTLAESGNLLMSHTNSREGDWAKDAKLLTDAGMAAYQAAQAKDAKALAALADSLDASCTTCHKQYRPNVFPREGGSR
jgi:hypothetical protein